jgi:hypothetical protein
MDVQAVVAPGAGPSEAGPLSSAPLAPARAGAEEPVSQPTASGSGPLSPIVAKILGGASSGEHTVNVSYRVMHDPNIIVTVFTDPNTGVEIAQCPPEVLVQIAQFFDKQTGVTLDRSA